MMPLAEPVRDDWEAFWDADDGDNGTRRLALAVVAGAVIVLTAATLWIGRLSARRQPMVPNLPSAADIIVRPPPPR